MVVEGPPGIGKTHLLTGVVDNAVEAAEILRANPAQAEVRLVGSALMDPCGTR